MVLVPRTASFSNTILSRVNLKNIDHSALEELARKRHDDSAIRACPRFFFPVFMVASCNTTLKNG